MKDSLLFESKYLHVILNEIGDSTKLVFKNSGDSIVSYIFQGEATVNTAHAHLKLSLVDKIPEFKLKILSDVAQLSDSLNNIVLLVFGASFILVFGKEYIITTSKIIKRFFLLLIPTWFLFGMSVSLNKEISNSKFTLYFIHSLAELNASYFNMSKMYQCQYYCFITGCCFIAVIVLANLFWWVKLKE